MKILVNFATRGRPGKFINVMDKLRKLTAEPEKVIVLIKADNDDHHMKDRDMMKFLRYFNDCGIRWHLTFAERTTKIGAINRDIALIKGWDVLVNISDDMTPDAPAWDTVIRTNVSSVWADSTDFFAHFSDGRVDERLCTLSIIGKDYFQRDGYVYHPLYKSFSCDAEAMYVAMMRGKHHYFPKVLFRHDHAAYVKDAKDLLYKENSRHSEYDTSLYFERLNRYFEVPKHERTCVPFQQYMTA